ncbi:hypothetical protein B0O80DRAFT_437108 [Mortierella sp. GBAus27b]|nr:hypothetical protein B0O80DRAFT_437108 [Mortierella sp. GBAus27b]
MFHNGHSLSVHHCSMTSMTTLGTIHIMYIHHMVIQIASATTPQFNPLDVHLIWAWRAKNKVERLTPVTRNLVLLHTSTRRALISTDSFIVDGANCGMAPLGSTSLTCHPPSLSCKLLVMGANGRTGVELVKQGLERNYRVTAFVRDDKVLLEDSSLRKNQNLLIVRGSPTCQADVDGCVEGQDVVVNVIGARLMSGDPTISSHSQVILNNAMKKHGVRRLIVVTSYGCLGLRNYLISTKKLFSRVFMTGILKDKVLQEEIIQRDTSSLDWTIVRPITLKDGDLSEKYFVSSDELPSTSKVKMLTRPDLAHYIIAIINAPEEYHAIRSIAGRPRPSKPKPFCPFERRELARQQKEQEKELEKKSQTPQQQQYHQQPKHL